MSVNLGCPVNSIRAVVKMPGCLAEMAILNVLLSFVLYGAWSLLLTDPTFVLPSTVHLKPSIQFVFWLLADE